MSKLKNPIWLHFVQIKMKVLLKARCNKCRKLLGATSGFGTSRLREHIERCPQRTIKDIRQILLSKNLKGEMVKASGIKLDEEEGRQALASAIMLHGYSQSMVDHIGFRRFFIIIQPLHDLIAAIT
ncbi:hypothetical protein LINPERPRIM_LOCUS20761 [Linum perenne]